MSGGDVLVSLPHADGTAGVIREEDGTVWLTGSIEDGPGTMLDDHRGSIEGLGDDRIVQAGLLPAAAVSAELLDHAGNSVPATVGPGVWIAVLDHHDDQPEPVIFRDAGGALVRPPLPADWPREPVTDARHPCVVCGAHDWEEVTPLDDSRGMHGTSEADMQPVKFVSCRACGHEICSGGWVTITDDGAAIDEAEQARRREEFLALQHAENRRLLATCTLPVFVLAAWEGERHVAGHGSSGGELTSVTIGHGDEAGDRWARVEFDADDPWEGPETAARSALSRLIESRDEWDPELSFAALSIGLDHREREAARVAHRAPVEHVAIGIDGQPHEAVFARHDDTLVCVLDAPGGRIMVSGRGMGEDELELVKLGDPVAEL